MWDDRREKKRLLLRSPAKVNLGLRILGLRPDGYHELETWMQKVSLFDRIELETARRGIRVSTDRPDVPSGPGNIAYQAARALRELSGDRSLGAVVRIEKHIPAGAGLGGGSGNASAVLWGLNRLWGLGLPASRLRRLAARLGSDVPFFLGGPAAVCRGRGERVEPRQPLRNRWILLVKPAFSLDTAQVYGWSREKLISSARSPKMRHRPYRTRIAAYRNDLEGVVFPRYPVLEEICRALQGAGAGGALMSGSGSAIFGVFRRRRDAERAGQIFCARRRWAAHLVRPLEKASFLEEMKA